MENQSGLDGCCFWVVSLIRSYDGRRRHSCGGLPPSRDGLWWKCRTTAGPTGTGLTLQRPQASDLSQVQRRAARTRGTLITSKNTSTQAHKNAHKHPHSGIYRCLQAEGTDSQQDTYRTEQYRAERQNRTELLVYSLFQTARRHSARQGSECCVTETLNSLFNCTSR